MPKAWSGKRERQYEHVKQSEKKQGRSTKRAKEIAARTVNKQRAQKGEAKSSSSRSRSGSSDGGKTREQLYQQAKRLGIEGRSKMNKQQLQRAVSRRS
jgi:Rho termination factor, N-terminal domain